jgi:hypothetical protein
MEYLWKTYTFDQNIESKINNKAADGWIVKTMLLRQEGVGEKNCVVYVLYEKET